MIQCTIRQQCSTPEDRPYHALPGTVLQSCVTAMAVAQTTWACAAGDLYLAAMDAVNPINPDALFTIKGADQSVYAFNGGQGFVTDETLVAETQSSNPNAFFRTLLAKSYANQVKLFRL